MNPLSTTNSFLRFLRGSGLFQLLGPRATVQAVRELQARFAQLAVDAHQAEARGVPFCTAVSDMYNYPHLTRFHAEMETVLQLPVPAPLDTWLERILSGPDLPVADALQSGLVEAAVVHTSPTTRALARYLVFMGVWLNLRVLYLRDPASLIKLGVDADDLLAISEFIMRDWLKAPVPTDDDLRPYHVLVAEAFVALPIYGNAIREVYGITQHDLEHAEQEAMLAQMDGIEAVLLRNHLAGANDLPQLAHRRHEAPTLSVRKVYVIYILRSTPWVSSMYIELISGWLKPVDKSTRARRLTRCTFCSSVEAST